MDIEDIEITRDLTVRSVLLGVYPSILVQFEPYNGGWRIGVDYDYFTPEEVVYILQEVIRDIEEQEWVNG